MAGYATHRSRLIARLRSHGVLRTPAVIEAFGSVPREEFVPSGAPPGSAYQDRALVLTTGHDGRATSTISQPSMVAHMLEQLAVRPGDRILEIGTASGYNAALLAALAGPRGTVHSVELDPALADRARERLRRLAPTVTVLTGDGWAGVPGAAPFDRIVVTVGIDDLAPAWFGQLADGGSIVAPVTVAPGLELSVELVRTGAELRSASVQPCGFVRLRGPHAAWPNRTTTSVGTVVTRDALDPATARAVREAVELGPQDGGLAPELVPGWSSWLALDHPHAIAIVAPDSPSPAPVGLRDPRTGGLAVVDRKRIAWFGDRSAAGLLRVALRSADGVDARGLQLRVRPVEAPATTGRWTVDRPHHRFTLWLAQHPGQVPE